MGVPGLGEGIRGLLGTEFSEGTRRVLEMEVVCADATDCCWQQCKDGECYVVCLSPQCVYFGLASGTWCPLIPLSHWADVPSQEEQRQRWLLVLGLGPIACEAWGLVWGPGPLSEMKVAQVSSSWDILCVCDVAVLCP